MHAGKTIFRPPDVAVPGVHAPIRLRRRGDAAAGLNLTRPLLVGNHYFYRSRADVALKAAGWPGRNRQHRRNYNLTDALLWGRKEDRRLREEDRRLGARRTAGCGARAAAADGRAGDDAGLRGVPARRGPRGSLSGSGRGAARREGLDVSGKAFDRNVYTPLL